MEGVQLLQAVRAGGGIQVAASPAIAVAPRGTRSAGQRSQRTCSTGRCAAEEPPGRRTLPGCRSPSPSAVFRPASPRDHGRRRPTRVDSTCRWPPLRPRRRGHPRRRWPRERARRARRDRRRRPCRQRAPRPRGRAPEVCRAFSAKRPRPSGRRRTRARSRANPDPEVSTA